MGSGTGFSLGSLLSQDNGDGRRNPWPWFLVGGIVVVVIVNIIFITTAFMTTPGLVDNDYYEKGRYHDANYQEVMEARNRLGWNIKLQTPASLKQGEAANFNVNVVDKVGMPLKEATVTILAYRPSDASADMQTELERIADGVFQSKLALPLKGIWDLKVTVAQGEESLNTSRRVSVTAN